MQGEHQTSPDQYKAGCSDCFKRNRHQVSSAARLVAGYFLRVAKIGLMPACVQHPPDEIERLENAVRYYISKITPIRLPMFALEVRNLRKTYRNGPEALKGVSLQVVEGDFFALLGPNGAGKSTLIGIIASLVNATSGETLVFGNSVQRERSRAMTHIGLVPQEQNFNLFEKPFEIVCNQAGYYGIPRKIARVRAEKYLRQLQLWDKAFTIARNLSGGMKRRLMIARAMVNEPRLLILDEPTAGVDIEIRRSMWDFIRQINENGTTVILTTHYLEEAEQLCRNIAIIDHGLIIQNTDMKSLLATLDVETFILDLRESISQCPKVEGMEISMRDDKTLVASLPKKKSLNLLFAELAKRDIHVLSMRNKANRLEELFLGLVEKNTGNRRAAEPDKGTVPA